MRDNLTSERHRLERAWAIYQEQRGDAPSGVRRRPAVAREIVQSWQRSSLEVSPAQRTAPVDDPQETLREWRGSLLYAAAAPLLHEIEQTAETNDFIVGFCDASGKLLWTHTGKHMQRRADKLHFVPGGHWDERSVGTNALALALRQGLPSQVFSAEHYLEAVHDWVCYSAPIRDPATGLSLGVLDFSTTWQRHNPLGLMTATALARYVETRLETLVSVLPRPEDRAQLPPAPLQLELCGPPRVTLHGKPLKLTPRRLEILALLALHPQGLDLDALHAHLYGNSEVSFSTLKAEISGLRGALGGKLGSRPYHLTLDVAFDALELQDQLEAGELHTALSLYRGPLLPESNSPTLDEWRRYLETALRESTLQQANPEPLWSLVRSDAGGLGSDPELLFRLKNLLYTSDPRLALVEARLQLVG